MATSGRGSGVVGYNVQVAVETENHLIITHDVTTKASIARAGFSSSIQGREAVARSRTCAHHIGPSFPTAFLHDQDAKQTCSTQTDYACS